MSLPTLPTELILCIIGFLDKNKDAASLVSTCKKLWAFGKKGFAVDIGFLENINYLESYFKHARSAHTIRLNNIDDPELWLFTFPRRIYLTNCRFNNKFTPARPPAQTKVLYIEKTEGDILIDWKAFPNLKTVMIYCRNINTGGLKDLKEIEYAHISTRQGISQV